MPNADINSRDSFGFTPLHLAADRGHPQIIKRLLHLGADPDIQDPDRQTALQLAQIAEQAETALLLISIGSSLIKPSRGQ